MLSTTKPKPEALRSLEKLAALLILHTLHNIGKVHLPCIKSTISFVGLVGYFQLFGKAQWKKSNNVQNYLKKKKKNVKAFHFCPNVVPK